MQHLENMQHLREGIHWRSVGQRDPLVEYRSESQKLFDNLERNLREEVLKVMLSLTKSDAAKTDVEENDYDTELTKMAASSSEKGVNEVQSGNKNLDAEFKKTTKKSPKPTKKAKKSRKKNQKRH